MKRTALGMLPLVILAIPTIVFSKTGDYWELVNPKTNEVLDEYQPMMGPVRNDSSQASGYERLILRALGCSSQEPANTKSTATRPCKFQKLFIDPAADGSPQGRALAQALTKAFSEVSGIALVAHVEDAEALFICHDEYEQWVTSRKELAASSEKKSEEEAEEKQLAAAGRVGKARRYIAYVVETDCDNSRVDVTYSMGRDQTEQMTERAPWAMLLNYPSSFYYVAAQKNDSSICNIAVAIYRVELTRNQVDVWSSSETSQVSFIKRHGKALREADSDASFGIANVTWSAE